jgi:hypothetical protein
MERRKKKKRVKKQEKSKLWNGIESSLEEIEAVQKDIEDIEIRRTAIALMIHISKDTRDKLDVLSNNHRRGSLSDVIMDAVDLYYEKVENGNNL